MFSFYSYLQEILLLNPSDQVTPDSLEKFSKLARFTAQFLFLNGTQDVTLTNCISTMCVVCLEE